MAFDGSDNARRALDRGIDEAKKSKGELSIIVVADDSVFFARSTGVLYAEIVENLLEQARGLLSGAEARAGHARLLNVHGSVEVGNPPDAILAAAKAQKADLIIVGRRGASRIERFLMGSVSSKVIDHAEADVLVVR